MAQQRNAGTWALPRMAASCRMRCQTEPARVLAATHILLDIYQQAMSNMMIANRHAGSPPCCGKFGVTLGAIPLDNIAADNGLPTSAVAAYNGLPIDTQVQQGQSLSIPCGRIIALVAPQLGGPAAINGGGGRRLLGVSGGGGSPQVFLLSERLSCCRYAWTLKCRCSHLLPRCA